MRVPAAVAAIPLLAGSAAGVLLVDSIPERLILAFAASAVITLIAAFGLFEEGLHRVSAATIAAGFAAAGMSMGLSSAHALYTPALLHWFDTHQASAGDPLLVEGILHEDAALTENGVTLSVDVDRIFPTRGVMSTVAGGVRLSVGGNVSPGQLESWRAGRRVRLPSLLRHPTVFRDPGVQDETRPLARRGIVLVGSVKSAALVDVIRRGSVIDEVAALVRARVRRVLANRIGPYGRRSAAIATAIVIGDRTGLSEDDERRLRDGGTYHVIAISGGNIAILTAMLMGAARLLRVHSRAAASVSIALLLFYGEVAGGTASVERAVTGAVVFLAATLVDQRGSPLNTLSIAGVIGAAIAPEVILDPGFLLSFGATAGIMLGVPRLSGSRASGDRWWCPAARAAWGLFAATVAAEIALLPIAALLFSRITYAGLALNFAAIPLMTVVQGGSMALVALGTHGLRVGGVIAFMVHRGATWLVESARLVDVVPWLATDVAPPAWWLLTLYYLGCAGLLLPDRVTAVRRARWCGGGAVAASALLITISPSWSSSRQVPIPVSGTLRIVVLDVGQGDATVVTLPDRTSLLVDAAGLGGTTFDMAGRVILPALRALGVRQLHALVLTHGDPDHIGGADRIIQRLSPRDVWEGVPVPPHAGLRGLMQRADATHAMWRTVAPGEIDRLAGVAIRVLHPAAPDWERQRVRNDDSIVLQIDYGDLSILLPGDIGSDVERVLTASLKLRPKVILKAAHHGSATSSSEVFLEAVRPKAVIFSTGSNNRFGHPAPVVTERFRRRGVEMFNTATDGAVFVETDGTKVEVRGWTGKKMMIR